jgi:hypothetical protein
MGPFRKCARPSSDNLAKSSGARACHRPRAGPNPNLMIEKGARRERLKATPPPIARHALGVVDCVVHALRLRCPCATIALSMRYDCVVHALRLRCPCATIALSIALRLRCPSTTIALPIDNDCVADRQRLRCRSTTIALSIARHALGVAPPRAVRARLAMRLGALRHPETARLVEAALEYRAKAVIGRGLARAQLLDGRVAPGGGVGDEANKLLMTATRKEPTK